MQKHSLVAHKLTSVCQRVVNLGLPILSTIGTRCLQNLGICTAMAPSFDTIYMFLHVFSLWITVLGETPECGFGTIQRKKKTPITKFISQNDKTPPRKPHVAISFPEDFRRVSAIIDVDIVPETHRRVRLMKNGSEKPLGFYIRDGVSVRVTPHGLEKVIKSILQKTQFYLGKFATSCWYETKWMPMSLNHTLRMNESCPLFTKYKCGETTL